MNWYVNLKGNDFELKCLSNYINTEEVCIELEDGERGQYILKSNEFFEFKKSYDVLKKQKKY